MCYSFTDEEIRVVTYALKFLRANLDEEAEELLHPYTVNKPKDLIKEQEQKISKILDKIYDTY